ncbi:FixH family protein [Oceaniglobus roseus]|uniref:FixH family protein n=1 Tax=Oceaniglobus roseus TaxID=1737570 RepID=UPI000C7EE3E8|nr:FixH family protein [Kandeliimicrobium roseum]
MTDRKLTGWHVLAMFTGGFAIIIAVNVALAVEAVKTFPGLEVANSYVESQKFDARRAAQDALGWDVRVEYADGVLTLAVTDRKGRAVDPARFTGTIGRPTTRAQDRALSFDANGEQRLDLPKGNWRLDLQDAGPEPVFTRAYSITVQE